MTALSSDLRELVPNQVTPLRRRMMAEHADLEAVLDRLTAAFECGDRDVAAQEFARFEQRLLDHLGYEDRRLLPLLEQTDAKEAAVLAADHARIRARLHELGIGVELHYTRATIIAELVAMLRAHASREDAALYRVAEAAGLVREAAPEHAPLDDQC